MNTLNENIAQFLNECQIASVCFINKEQQPYCINCFYAFDIERAILVCKSSPGTYHHSLVINAKDVAGTILPNEVNTLKIKGVQFNGKIITNDLQKLPGLNSLYYKKYPFALTIPGYIWAIELHSIKLTDNTLVFGKKESWER